MKKTIFILFACLLMGWYVNAQNAKPTVVDFNKKSQTAVIAHYDMPALITEGALRKKMTDSNIKGGNMKDGFISYQGVVVPEIFPEKMDVYFKVEEDKGHSNLYMLTSKGYENFMNRESDPEAYEKSLIWLNEFARDVMRFGYQDGITKNELRLKDLEKDLKKAVKNGASLAKDKTRSEGKAAENKQEIVRKKSEVDNQYKTLEFVRAKTGTIEQMDAIKKEIGKQEDAVKKANKSYQHALDDAEDYRQDIEKAGTELVENESEQVKLKTEMDQVKAILADLKGKLGAIK